MNALLKSQFNYCPLIWMYHSRNSNKKETRVHERCLCIVYNYKKCRITPGARSALQGNSDFMNKIEANDLILVLRHVLLVANVIAT